jgi:hypothetical protein
MVFENSPNECWILERSRPENDTRGSVIERFIDSLACPKATSDLHANPLTHRLDDSANDRPLTALPCSRAIEIDDVQPSRSSVHECAGDAHRVR